MSKQIKASISPLHPEVTGSCMKLCIHLPNGHKEIYLIDCGLFQEPEYDGLNYEPIKNCNNINAVLVTHGHVDHIGRLPFLIRCGYRGPIYATHETVEISKISLFDCYKVKAKEKVSLYDENDVKNSILKLRGVEFLKEFKLSETTNVTFIPNGHVLGAAMIYVTVSYQGKKSRNFLFTGDYKASNFFFDVQNFPEYLKNKPVTVITESTYCDPEKEVTNSETSFKDSMNSLVSEKKDIILPTISLERLPLVLSKIKEMQDKNLLDDYSIVVDSALGLEYLNKIYIPLFKDKFLPHSLRTIHDAFERNDFIASKKPKIILCSSGMCDNGLAPFYLSNFISKENAAVLITCYSPKQTLAYKLLNNKGTVCIDFQKYFVKAKILKTSEFSSHGNEESLIDLFSALNVTGFFVNHGTSTAKEHFANLLASKFNVFATSIDRGYTYYVHSNNIISSRENSHIKTTGIDFLPSSNKHLKKVCKYCKKKKANTKY